MKLYLISGLIAAFLIFITGEWFIAVNHGKLVVQKKLQDQTIAYKKKEDSLLLKLDKAQKERKVIYRDKVKIIEKSTDSCANTPVPDDIKRLLDPHSQ